MKKNASPAVHAHTHVAEGLRDEKRKRKEQTTPFGINFMRSLIIYKAAKILRDGNGLKLVRKPHLNLYVRVCGHGLTDRTSNMVGPGPRTSNDGKRW